MGGLGLPYLSGTSEVAFEAAQEVSDCFLDGTKDPRAVPSQRVRSKPIFKVLRDIILYSVKTNKRLQFIENSSKIGSAWLRYIPVDKFTRLEDWQVAAALRSRTLTRGKLSDEVCPNCFHKNYNSHQERCVQHGHNRVGRHESIKYSLIGVLKRAGSTVKVEPERVVHGKAYRPDFLVDGLHAVDSDINYVDVTVVSVDPKEEETWTGIKQSISNQLDYRYTNKLNKYSGKLEYLLLPFVLSTGGVLHQASEDYIEHLDNVGLDTRYLMQRMSIQLIRWRTRAMKF
jgi:hypothetical protein